MGGMSFKCPYCDTWKLAKGPLKDHLKDKHSMTKIRIEGKGSMTYIVSEQTNATYPKPIIR